MSRLRRDLRALLLLMFVFGVPHGSAAQDRDAFFQAIIVDAQGKALPRVTVVIRSRTGQEQRNVTDNDGLIFFGDLTPGPYELIIDHAGFAPFRGPVTVAPGDAEADLTKLPRIVLKSPTPDFEEVRDRWRLRLPIWQRYPEDTESPFVRGRRLNPFNQNVLKGDLPIAGENLFLNLTLVSETPFEYRRVPTPSGVSTEREDGDEFFGDSRQYAVLPTGAFSVELFRGSTSFQPRDWAVRVTPVVSVNYVSTKERNGLNASPEEGPTRRREFLSLQEAFGEVKVANVGPNFDFISVRGGIQPFNSDFRGFLFRDTNLGVRAFGTWGRNRNQWNVAFFDQLEKETNSDLNLRELRKQRVLIANWYRQDFLVDGYTISPSFHANWDQADEFFFDENGFLVRPSPIGEIRLHEVTAYYGGFGGDGHWGRLNLTHQFYQAFGTDEFNGIAGRETRINAQFAAAEVSVDKGWWRPKLSVVWASGDADPEDDEARGFDAIIDNPNIAGGPFSFWVRQGIRAASTSVGLVGRSSLLPSLRSSKAEGQANFVNPGLFLLNGGLDADLTTKLRLTANVNYLRFDKTETLQKIFFQGEIDKAIGVDSSVGFQYRPWLNDNVIISGGASIFTPGTGFKQILTRNVLYTPFVVLTLTY
jgi:hypothetical protein